ncbi:MAG TPA: XRE family transcriptional regulator [Micromonosporaceae bacterium]
MNLSRREFARLLAGGALSTVLPAEAVEIDHLKQVAKTLSEPHRAGPQVLRYFTVQLEQHFTADRMLGPRQLVGPVLAQIEVLERLRRQTRPGTTEAMLRLLAQYGEFAGWLHQDLGDINAAMHWSDRAVQWAQAAGDYQMVAYLLVRKSNIALLDDDPLTVIELAAAARKVPEPISPKLHALAAQQEARGWALHRNADQFRRHLDKAATLLRDHPDDLDATAPVYLHQYNLDTLEEQSAGGFRACGQAETAVEILERKIAATPDHLRRDQGHQLVKLANALLTTEQPDPERAAALGVECVATAETTGSARIVKELRALDQTLSRRWPTLPGTHEVHGALHAA